jgi:hypothetical protein
MTAAVHNKSPSSRSNRRRGWTNRVPVQANVVRFVFGFVMEAERIAARLGVLFVPAIFRRDRRTASMHINAAPLP